MTETERDPVVARALRGIPVPDHAPDFWDRLEQRLALDHATRGDGGEAGAVTGSDALGDDEPVLVPLPTVRRSRWHRPTGLLAAAAVLVALVAAALVVGGDDDPSEVDVATAPTTRGPADDAPDGDAPAPTTTVPAYVVDPAAAVLAFLDALGGGDLDAAAARLGPVSEARLIATSGSVEDVLVVAEEGFGAWAATPDRRTEVVELGPGEAVVVISGTLNVEGMVEERHDAFPVRYAESAEAWLVEPWAVAAEDRLDVLNPAAARGEGWVGDEGVRMVVPGPGTAWLSVDGGPAVEAATVEDGVATWPLPEGLGAGTHTGVVAYADDGAVTAMAAAFTVDG